MKSSPVSPVSPSNHGILRVKIPRQKMHDVSSRLNSELNFVRKGNCSRQRSYEYVVGTVCYVVYAGWRLTPRYRRLLRLMLGVELLVFRPDVFAKSGYLGYSFHLSNVSDPNAFRPSM